MSIARRGELVGGRYLVEEPIGRGANASVFRARDQTLARPVAIKFLFVHDERRREWLADRFLREARIAASVDHPNVARTTDFGTHEGRPYMVMALLEGESLAERLARAPAPSLGEIVDVACEVLAGLDAIHRAGIVHRDLKPENVILVRDGGLVRAKIVDFGVSRAVQTPTELRSALTTRDGLVVGTPEYMSPEQARGEGQVDFRIDLYAMGVVLYEALTGALPYRARHVADLIVAITEGGAPSVGALRPELPAALSAVVARAMALDPGARWSSAAEMAQALLDATERRAGDAGGRGSWLPASNAERTPTLSEYQSRPPEPLAIGPTVENPSGTFDVPSIEIERAVERAALDATPPAAPVTRRPGVQPPVPPAPGLPSRRPERIDSPPTRSLREGVAREGGARDREGRASPRPAPSRSVAPLSLPVPMEREAGRGEAPPLTPRLPSARAEAGRESISLPPVPSRGPASPSRAAAPKPSAAPETRPPVISYQAQLAEAMSKPPPVGASFPAPDEPLEVVRPKRAAPARVGLARARGEAPRRQGGRSLVVVAVLLALATAGAVASRDPRGRAALGVLYDAVARVAPWLVERLPFRNTVRVHLVGVPRRAQIRLDGLPIGVEIFDVPRDGAIHLVEVLAAGREPWQASFEAKADLTYHVILREPAF